MISLEASTRTCKVDTASAARSESDRFLNPNNVVWPVWTGLDLSGRTVCADSFYTKRAGCNSAADRVLVENSLRPQYFDYINLSDVGLRGELYANNMYYQDAGVANRQLKNTQNYAGNFNLQPAGQFESTCSYNAYENGQKQVVNQQRRNRAKHHPPQAQRPRQLVERYNGKEFARRNAALTNGYRSCKFRAGSGF